MIFSSLLFIFIFLPVTLLLYYIVPKKFKNLVLLVLSLVFYAWGEPVYIFLMMFSIAFNYFSALQMESYEDEEESPTGRKACFIVTVVVNIGLLALFKYYGFFINNLIALTGLDISHSEISLPIGISFYTFQALSYIIDVYYRRIAVQKNIIDFGAYITMFPQLIAGPIVRYKDIASQLKDRVINMAVISDGVAWFIRGLGKKVLLANNIGMLFDSVAMISYDERAALTSWLGIIAYTFQIYFDFSGYSDMAIGLGKMLGFEFPENFNYPYISTSATDFWRRWHISLSTWFREYLYIPLGGNRVGPAKHIRNLFVVWLLTGFWHGASWTFILWGLYWGILLLLEKYVYGKKLEAASSVIKHTYSILAFVFGWLIFSSNGITDLAHNFISMFGLAGNGFADSTTIYYLTSNLILLIVCGFFSTPLIWNTFIKMARRKGGMAKIVPTLCYIVMFLLCVASLVNASYNPFLYFRF